MATERHARSRSTGGGYTFLVFKGNNASVIRKALQRRPWWSVRYLSCSCSRFSLGTDLLGWAQNVCPLPTAVPAEDTEDDDGKGMSLARRDREKRKLVALQKDMQEKAFAAQNFSYCWKPTLAVMQGPTGATTTLHNLQFGGRKPQLVNHFSTINCLTSKTGLLR